MTKTKLTLEELIQEKEKHMRDTSKKKQKDLLLSQKGASITIEEPALTLVNESVEIGKDENQESNGDDFLVYNVVIEPDLKNAELQKVYECLEPIDIVHKLFDPGTVSGIAVEAMKLAGYMSNVTPVDKLKN